MGVTIITNRNNEGPHSHLLDQRAFVGYARGCRLSSNTNVLISETYAGTMQNATLTVTSGRHH